jgi:hypothetical protein
LAIIREGRILPYLSDVLAQPDYEVRARNAGAIGFFTNKEGEVAKERGCGKTG